MAQDAAHGKTIIYSFIRTIRIRYDSKSALVMVQFRSQHQTNKSVAKQKEAASERINSLNVPTKFTG